MTEPIEEYRARLARWQQRLEEKRQLYHRLGNARLAAGVVLVAIAGASLGPGWISTWWLVAPVAALAVMIAVHPKVDGAVREATRGVGHYERAIARLEDRWSGMGHGGDRWKQAGHVYADDLDVFGRGSLFELVSTARTGTGERILAGWLQSPGEPAEVAARQEAVRELRERIDLREDLALMGEDIRAALDDRLLAAWGSRDEVRFFTGARWIAVVLALAASAALIAWFAQAATLRPFLYLALVEFGFALAIRNAVREVTTSVQSPARELRLIALLLERLEREQFASPGLAALGEKLRHGGRPATEQIQRLETLVERMDWARNQIFALISAPLLWIPQCAMAIERWRADNGSHIADWVSAVGEFEALGSLAGFAYERPRAQFPELLETGAPVYQAEGLVHPLIRPAEAVANDVTLGGAVQVWIVSGSNMSGKSTLLRAVGLSVAMAWAGAPVTAARLRLSRLWVGASISTHDSLADNRSRFYAEISRLKQIVDVAGAGPERSRPVLFLLDELLSGTNSHDRRIGAEALLRGLMERGAIGIATTHDLALAEIAAGFGAGATNVHFEDHLEGGEIRFDYLLKPGVVERSNALELMRAVGLKV